MSKYYKAEDVINLLATEYYTNALAEGFDVKESDFKEDAIANTKHLPTIEVSEDCISRSKIAEQIEKYKEPYMRPSERWLIDDIIKVVENAPSVLPSRAEGEWMPRHHQGVDKLICECSNCHTLHVTTNYCPNCGAKMKGAEE